MLGDQLILQYYYRVSSSREGPERLCPAWKSAGEGYCQPSEITSKTHVHLNQVYILAYPGSLIHVSQPLRPQTCVGAAPGGPPSCLSLLFVAAISSVAPGQSPSLPSLRLLLVINGFTRGHRRPRDASSPSKNARRRGAADECIVWMCARTCRYPNKKQRPPPKKNN